MADVPQVTIVNGIPTAGSGTVETLSTVKALIGEVSATPTANTLLDQTKTLNTSIQSLVTSVVPLGQAAAADSQPVVIASDRQNTLIVSVTLSLDTSVYAAGDVMATTQIVNTAFVKNDGAGVLQSVTVYDADDNTAFDFDIHIHRTSTTLGTENSTISISAANAIAAELKTISFLATEAIDLINLKKYEKDNLGIAVRAVSGTDDLYISMVCKSGTPTHTASGVVVLLGILQD